MAVIEVRNPAAKHAAGGLVCAISMGHNGSGIRALPGVKRVRRAGRR